MAIKNVKLDSKSLFRGNKRTKNVGFYGSKLNVAPTNQASGFVSQENPFDLTGHIEEVINTVVPGLIPPAEIDIANAVVVHEGGDDLTGMRERLDLPFATPWAAVAAAQAGDTVVVYPGTYTNPNFINGDDVLVKDGVNVFMYPNVNIEYTSTSGGNSPFWDQGQPVTAKIWGYGNIRINNGIFPDYQTWLTHPDSDLQVECNSLSMRRRIRVTNGKRLHITCHEEIRCTYVQILSIRLAPNTDMDLQVHAPDWWADITDAGTDTDYSAVGLRDFGPGGRISLKGRLHYYDTFFSTGVQYLEDLECPVEIDMIYKYEGRGLGNGVYLFDDRTKMIAYVVRERAQWDVNIHLDDHVGMFLGSALAFGTLPSGSSGNFNITGEMEMPASPWSGSFSALANFPNDSRVNVNLDLDISNLTTSGNLSRRHAITLSSTSESVHYTGKIRYNDNGDATRFPFGILAFPGAPTATLKDLVVESIGAPVNGLAYSPGGGVENIKCMNVFSNVAFDPANYAAIIEAVTVSPNVKA
jgi:hypothetical protein